MKKNLLSLATGLIAFNLLFWMQMSKAQRSHPTPKEKELPPGVYLLRVDKPLKALPDWDIWNIARDTRVIGRHYIHKGLDPKTKKECGGDVVRGDELTDEGTVLLKCKKCGREWVAKEAEPR